MPTTLSERLSRELEGLRESGLLISPKVLETPNRAHTRIDGRDVLNLASNNYLGFADHPALKERAEAYLREWGAGAGAVRGIAGTLRIHEDFEQQLAEFKHTGSALVLHSGFTTNQGVLGALLQPDDLVISDELNHASIIDGLRLTKATKKIFKHADIADLERVLQENDSDGLKLVVTDGVFSMDGDIAPLDKIVEVARRYGAVTYVDDAHGSGVLGADGRGTVHHFGFEHADDVIQVGTLSKAWGGVGGYAAGHADLRQLLINRARPYLFSTAQPPAVVGALSAALEEVQRDPSLMERLWDNTRYFKAGIEALGFDHMGSQTPITPVVFGEAPAAFEASRRLLERGIFATGIGFPTVPLGKARIRNIVTAEHTRDDLDRALEAYSAVGKELGVI
ncbi:pyridoxal phosphate-dependent acyltransferase [Deinococcus proteolyticus MRP]|uniref:8-amino-7-ketopelargonate synthase n=1 Tax=Deinococcus proteolyticus (strain ATCC 35074 / DSM 20540 / JCM 6276 / NBRC 101906 / NCIMB 13154 / VKM Ac-1939 / CCM 2703 / MRP) TaxID=693977 RepID=F0RMQ9_DEIPM|nr:MULTISPECIES: glycine C-acetyltransferase [Deinococcus]ADY27127.1 pyridoxal phosphate-dependent acyltransferase [Deinococcus proteolyticus MRP]MCY1703252.1 glycine C-acetyltransferase [Deinococcus sp. SL84]